MEAKKIKNRTQLLIYILVILGLLVVVNYLGTKWFKRIDMTEGKEYSISASTKKILKNLDDIVNIKVYFSKNLPPNLTKVATDVKDILSEYKAYAGKNLRITWEDPAENDDARSMARSLGIPEVQMQTFEKDKAQVINGYLGIAVLYEDKKETLPVVQNLQNLEYDLTMAVMKVSRKSIPKIGILKIDTLPPKPPFMQQAPNSIPETTEEKLAQAYENLRTNYEVVTVDLSKGEPVDSTLKTLIIPGVANMTERKIFEIDQYFMKGGNLIVMADAIEVSMQMGVRAIPQESKLFDLLEHYGVRIEKNMVLDGQCGQVSVPQKFGPFQMNVAVPYPYFVRLNQESFEKKNPAVAPLSDVFFPWVSSLTLLVDKDSSKEKSSVQATVLARSSEKSWTATGYFDLNPQQKWAPPENSLSQYNLAAHLSGDFNSYFAGKPVPPVNDAGDTLSQIALKPGSQDDNRQVVPSNKNGNLVVIGDGDFVSGQNAIQGNIAMLLNLVDWLSLDDNLIAIRTRSLKDRTIEADLLKENSSKPNVIRLVNILVMPLLVVVFGLIVFIKRKEPVTVVSQEKAEEKK
ncbi:MAG TPA: GldG family protein [Chitinispirillaceae bacterium]|jgi:gliding-associated putative ABC transporter substrate-binding component GldG|nr:GldG family protein [Chitinispirillaceae bacterium]